MNDLVGTVLRIERISLNDGPGLRTVIFLKGCPLRCQWCSTPESQNKDIEFYSDKKSCTGCGKCVSVCPYGALTFGPGGTPLTDRSVCTGCGKCVSACPVGARRVYGKKMRVSEVIRKIEKDTVFYYHSGGGVTLSGGDVLLQADFAAEILKECREIGVNTTAELDMFGNWENVKKLLPYLDSFFADVKLTDGEKHRKYTGVHNDTVLENIRKADAFYAESGHRRPCITLRVPLIPGINAGEKELLSAAEFASSLKYIKALEFLPYHRLGMAAYENLGREYALRSLPALEREQARALLKPVLEKEWAFSVLLAGEKLNRNP